MVQIHFPTRNLTLAYYNDKFDLRRGDFKNIKISRDIAGRGLDICTQYASERVDIPPSYPKKKALEKQKLS